MIIATAQPRAQTVIMKTLRRLLIAALLALGLSPAFAQAPPVVPALPDTPRLTSYTIAGTTCACAVNFALYGNANLADYQDWVEVFLNGVRVAYNDPTYGWTITSPTGALASIARPITDAVLTFTNVQTGTVEIAGASRPARLSQWSENQGVSARNLNVAFTGIVAQLREVWDKINDVSGRDLKSQPGNTVGLLPLPAACADGWLGFDVTGLNPVCLSGGPGSGNVTGPASSASGDLALWDNATGTQLKDAPLSANLLAFFQTPTSANLAAAVTDETGTGPLVFANSPVFTTPNIGSATGHASLDLPLSGGGLTGKLTTLASASGGAGFNLPPGAAPTSPVNGDLWTTSVGLYARINGGTVGPFVQPSNIVASLGNASTDTSLTIAGTGAGPWIGAVTAEVNQAFAPTWTGLHTFTATAGGILETGSPNISESYSGVTGNFGLYQAMTAVGAATMETAAHFGITSAVGSGDILNYYKSALALDCSANSGSADCWGQTIVVNLGNGGTQRGGVGLEIDLNNAWGNYTGAPSNPYAASLLLTGTNTSGGYGACAICIEYGSTGTLWNFGIVSGPSTSFHVFNNAFIADLTAEPYMISDAGAHTDGLHLFGTYSGSAINVNNAATISGSGAVTGTTFNASAVTNSYSIGGTPVLETSGSEYTVLFDYSGTVAALQAGNTTDPTNYYGNTTHNFRSRAGVSFATISSTGLSVNNAHLLVTSTAPAISSCGTGSPAVAGSDNFGKITAGAGTLTSCVVNFGHTWGTAPSCVVSSTTAVSSPTVTASTTQLTIGGASLTGDTLTYACGSVSMNEPANDNFAAGMREKAA